MMKAEQIARVCHEANRIYCEEVGSTHSMPWSHTSQAIKDSTTIGVQLVIDYPFATPEYMHRKWMMHKIENGWSYGATKDEKKKQHPNIVPFDDLSEEEQAKDALFISIVRALASPSAMYGLGNYGNRRVNYDDNVTRHRNPAPVYTGTQVQGVSPNYDTDQQQQFDPSINLTNDMVQFDPSAELKVDPKVGTTSVDDEAAAATGPATQQEIDDGEGRKNAEDVAGREAAQTDGDGAKTTGSQERKEDDDVER